MLSVATIRHTVRYFCSSSKSVSPAVHFMILLKKKGSSGSCLGEFKSGS